jgi:hypothetical protein
LHARRGGPLLDVLRLVDHRHRVLAAEVLDDISAHVVADAVGVHFARASRCCIPSGDWSPTCSAIIEQFLNGNSASRPSTNARARRRGSTRRKRSPIGSSAHRVSPASGEDLRFDQGPPEDHYQSPQAGMTRKWLPRLGHRHAQDQGLRLEYQTRPQPAELLAARASAAITEGQFRGCVRVRYTSGVRLSCSTTDAGNDAGLVMLGGAKGSGRPASKRSSMNARSLMMAVPNRAVPRITMSVAAWAAKRDRPKTGCRKLVAMGAPIAPTPIPTERHGAWNWLA